MLVSKIREIIKNGEGIQAEFKECRTALNKNVYDTICSFLNRSGGELLLGVKDNGQISGIDKNHIERIKKEFTTAVNNPQKISPPSYLLMNIYDLLLHQSSIINLQSYFSFDLSRRFGNQRFII